jgi:hypothetical protein
MSTTDSHGPDDGLAATPEPAAGGAGDAPSRPARSSKLAKTAAPVVAALLIGGGVAVAVDHHSSSAASAGNTPSALGGALGTGGAAGGGVAGEQRIRGTVTAKTSATITLKASSGGSATYVVNSTTQIVRNGRSATLADVKVGDPAFVHVYPSSSGQMLVERLFAGTSASDSGPGFGPPPTSGGTTGPAAGSSTHI